MKMAILMLLALCSAVLCYSQKWKTTGVENTGKKIYYNADDITMLDMDQHKNVIKAWFKEEFVNHKISDVLYPSGFLLTLYAFDCSENIWSINELIFHKTSGQVIRDYTYETEWRKALAGSPMTLLSYFICRKCAAK